MLATSTAAAGLNSVKPFESYFSDESIIEELCKIRVREAKRRNETLFLHRISSSSAKASDKSALDIFPPRRSWHRFRPTRRGKKPSLKLNQTALSRAMNRLRASGSDAGWVQRLDTTIKRIRQRALDDEHFAFAKPKILAQERDRRIGEYRPIANFPPEDKVIDCLTARYLREHLDGMLDNACLAFRCAKPGLPPPGFHHAIEAVLNLKRRHGSNSLYVAECDIRGFFDCVEHNQAWDALQQIIRQAKRRTPHLRIDSRALKVFRAYLACYSFSKNVKQEEQILKKRTRNESARYKWPEAELRNLYSDFESRELGVPQGGALSCLIANTVLHGVDCALRRLRRTTKPAFTYLRYCDDMIILAPDRSSCEAAFSRYQECLRALQLPIHSPKKVPKYVGSSKREFWEGKSNQPYRWGPQTTDGDIPWIQFVGYQVRYDGLLRIRKKSLAKHRKKLTQVTDDLLRQLNPTRPKPGQSLVFSRSIRKRPKQILHRLRQKLLSMSVGRKRIGDTCGSPMAMSWVAGFRGLFGKRFIGAMLQSLDRHRERQIKRVVRRLKNMPVSIHLFENSKIKVPKHFGHPFSYSAQLQNRNAVARMERKSKGIRNGSPLLPKANGPAKTSI